MPKTKEEKQQAGFEKKLNELFEFLKGLNKKYNKIFKILDFYLFIISDAFMDNGYTASIEATFGDSVNGDDIFQLEMWGVWAKKNEDRLIKGFEAYETQLEKEGKTLPKEPIGSY